MNAMLFIEHLKTDMRAVGENRNVYMHDMCMCETLNY